jgi:protein TonB
MAQKHRRSHVGRTLGIAGALVLAVALVGLIAWQMSAETKTTKKQNVQQIALIKPPPPPPPKPPEPKPPEIKKEEVKIQEQKVETPKDDPAPPQQARPLGIDADGAAGTDGFGLAANRGGRDITTIGGDKGDGGNRFGYHAGLVQRHVQDTLQKDKRLRGQEYRAVVNVWFRNDGHVQRAEVVGTSGKPDTDQSIVAALTEGPALRESLPADLPQPVKLRVTSRL